MMLDRAPMEAIRVHTHVVRPIDVVLKTPVLAHPGTEDPWGQAAATDNGNFLYRPRLTPSTLVPVAPPAYVRDSRPPSLSGQISAPRPPPPSTGRGFSRPRNCSWI